MAYNDYHLYMDDVEEGQSWISSARTITEADIVNFAGISGDFNPIHTDHEYARNTPYGKPIAHGLLTLAVTSGLSINSPPIRTLAFVGIKDWQFLEPVFIGDTIHIRSTLLEKEVRGRGRRALLTWQCEVLNQQEKVLQRGITTTLVEGRANLKNNSD
ncbi:MAG: MaoC family dehydratase N-terminal domain-containing protein [Planctomycetia bacterium]|nr:MaoC family dehydratase N-terminal domain-containing protein [Planctomycetia bacterium]